MHARDTFLYIQQQIIITKAHVKFQVTDLLTNCEVSENKTWYTMDPGIYFLMKTNK